jgi:two-component system nitrate/nitrite response regulator NarL
MPAVLVVSSVRAYREALAHALQESPTIEVVGTVADVADAQGILSRTIPEVALIDAGLPDAPAQIRLLGDAEPTIQVVAAAVSSGSDELLAFAEAGISGFVTREQPLGHLVLTIEAVATGAFPCSPDTAHRLLRHVGALAMERRARDGDGAVLTGREMEILSLIDDGRSNKEIALSLCIEVSTVKNHVHRILEKLHVSRRAEAAAIMRRKRLLTR